MFPVSAFHIILFTAPASKITALENVLGQCDLPIHEIFVTHTLTAVSENLARNKNNLILYQASKPVQSFFKMYVKKFWLTPCILLTSRDYIDAHRIEIPLSIPAIPINTITPQLLQHLIPEVIRNRMLAGELELSKERFKRVQQASKSRVWDWGITEDINDKKALALKIEAERQTNQNEITKAVIEAQELERSAIGKELHDHINQLLVTAKLYIEHARLHTTQTDMLLLNAVKLISKAVEDIRSLSKRLVPASLGHTGLKMAIEDLAASIRVLNKFKIQLQWKHFKENTVTENFKLTIYRIVQEQLNNIIRHARANNVCIRVTVHNKIFELKITDDGLGFDPLEKKQGLGLKNIRSRALLHHGQVFIESQKNNGCCLRLIFPLP
ncbi:MAG: hypothetical protein ABS68_04625 [Niastella sp. SCN 39-18]|nr:hypothetical protein [Sphingobacteriales bacterium]ODT53630.1 MAG: hypothetical protein ABS68_04625 [Niastella sp. SCN 39-18]OJW09359.1 MAG: hypothetical protein BGO53_02840 [Sphingobacteriales bacterium 39-19]